MLNKAGAAPQHTSPLAYQDNSARTAWRKPYAFRPPRNLGHWRPPAALGFRSGFLWLAKTDVKEYAASLHLAPFLDPVRMNFRRSWQLQKLMLRPETGTPILEEINFFVGVRYATVGLLVAVPEAALIRLRIFILQRRLTRLEGRAAENH